MKHDKTDGHSCGDMYRSLIISLALIVIYSTAVQSYPLPVDGSDVRDQDANDQHEQGDIHKRAIPLSLNGDLQALARMLYSQQRRRRVDKYASIRQKLYELGKRGEFKPQNDEKMETEDKYFSTGNLASMDIGLTGDNTNKNSKVNKRGPRLSINGALSTLADMLAASGRRRMQEEMTSNHERLLNLGKK